MGSDHIKDSRLQLNKDFQFHKSNQSVLQLNLYHEDLYNLFIYARYLRRPLVKCAGGEVVIEFRPRRHCHIDSSPEEHANLSISSELWCCLRYTWKQRHQKARRIW